jgi:hypothetical protein
MAAACQWFFASMTCSRGFRPDIAIEAVSEQDEGLTYSDRKNSGQK